LVIGDTSATIGEVIDLDEVKVMTDLSQSDLIAVSGGNIVLRTLEGSITLTDGLVSADAVAVSAHGSGNILIEAGGAGSDIDVNADVQSDFGDVTIIAGRSVRVSAVANVIVGTSGADSGTL